MHRVRKKSGHGCDEGSIRTSASGVEDSRDKGGAPGYFLYLLERIAFNTYTGPLGFTEYQEFLEATHAGSQRDKIQVQVREGEED